MKITVDWLKMQGACADAMREFEREFPGGAEYHAVLDRLADRPEWAAWLTRIAGPDIVPAGSLSIEDFVRVARILQGR